MSSMAETDTSADAYYGEDDPNTDEIDLSFLDEDQTEEK
jgi:hypothetical protein